MNRLQIPFATLALALTLLPLQAQQVKAPAVFVVPDSGRTSILLFALPPGFTSFTVERQVAGDASYEMLTSEPVGPVLDPLEAREMLTDAEFNWLKAILKAEDEFAVLRQLRSDPGAGMALSMQSLNVARILGRLFVDSLVQNGRSYTYRVRFLGFGRSPIADFEEKVRIRRHANPELRLTDLRARAGNGLVRLEWNYPAYQGEKSDIVVGFKVYRRVGGETAFRCLTPYGYLRTGDSLFYSDRSVENEQTYDYCVSAVDVIGTESRRSAIVTALPRDTTGPVPPPEVKGSEAEGRVKITWRPPADSSRIAGYNIYRSYSLHGEFTKINRQLIPKGVNLFVDDSVVTAALYVYRVTTVDTLGRESRPSAAGFGSPKDSTPPPPPLEVRAEVEKRMVRLSWKPQMTPDLDGYYVYRSEKPGDFFRLVGPVIGRDRPEFTDSGPAKNGLWPGKHYHYLVSQVDLAVNESRPETVLVLIPDDQPPRPPTSVYCRTTDQGFVEVEWQASIAWDIAKYRVYRQEGDRPMLLLRETGLTSRSLLDTTCRKGKTYAYVVAAVDSSQNEARAKPFAVTPRDIAAPQAPQGLKVSIGKKGVTLTWSAVAVPDLAGYNVYRAALPMGIPEKLNKEPLAQSKFTDAPGRKDFYYWVQALDTSGNESGRSEVLMPKP